MRKRLTKVAAAGMLAVVLFLLAAVGLRGSGNPAPATGVAAAAPELGVLLGPSPAVGSLDATIASLQARLETVPGDWQAAASLGIAHVQRARITADPTSYPLAESALARSLAIRPEGNAEGLVGMGSLAAARHDFAAALRWGRRAVRTAPFDADAYGLLGDAQLELGRYGAAFRSFQTMVDTRPSLASYARVSYARELRGDVDGAIRAMRAAYEIAGSRGDAAWAAAHVAKLHFGSGSVAEAEAWFRRARAADPTSFDAEAGLALVAWAHGDLDRAVAGYEDLVARYPTPEHVAVLGDLYAASGDREAAAAQRELVRAEARLFRANGVNTDLELALFEADHAEEGSARAALHAARAEWGRRKSIQVADAYAWALHANGLDRHASALSAQALHLGTRNALFLFHAGMIQLRLGHEERAEGLLRSAFEVNPNFSVRWSPVLRGTLTTLEGR
jgi:tetratricopeptide (TPR) repeat protein